MFGRDSSNLWGTIGTFYWLHNFLVLAAEGIGEPLMESHLFVVVVYCCAHPHLLALVGGFIMDRHLVIIEFICAITLGLNDANRPMEDN